MPVGRWEQSVSHPCSFKVGAQLTNMDRSEDCYFDRSSGGANNKFDCVDLVQCAVLHAHEQLSRVPLVLQRLRAQEVDALVGGVFHPRVGARGAVRCQGGGAQACDAAQGRGGVWGGGEGGSRRILRHRHRHRHQRRGIQASTTGAGAGSGMGPTGAAGAAPTSLMSSHCRASPIGR
jgi:hypothetical protein